MNTVTVRSILIAALFGTVFAEKTCSSDKECSNGCCFLNKCIDAPKSCCPITQEQCPRDCGCGVTGTDSKGCPAVGCLDPCSDVKCGQGTQCTYEWFPENFSSTASCRNTANGCQGIDCRGETRCYYNSTVPSVQCVPYDPCKNNNNACNASFYCDYVRPYPPYTIDDPLKPIPAIICQPRSLNPCKQMDCGKELNCYTKDGNSDVLKSCQNNTCAYPKADCTFHDACAGMRCIKGPCGESKSICEDKTDIYCPRTCA